MARAIDQADRDGRAALLALSDLGREPANDLRLAAVGPTLETSSRSLEALQNEIVPIAPLLHGARWLPGGLGWVADAPDALAAAAPLARAAAIVARPFSEAASSGDSARPRLSRYLLAASSLAPKEAELGALAAAAEGPLERLRGRSLGGPLKPFQGAVDRGRELLQEGRGAIEALGMIGPALGIEGQRTYLLLGQNDAEMRATGGFVGSVGIITVKDGAVASLDYTSSYNVDLGVPVPTPPGPLARYLGLGGWYLRDANWWPDFPATAAQVEMAWRRAGNGPVDGVIAVDSVALKGLLGVVGGVNVPGYGPVSADSFERTAAEQLYSRSALSSAQAFHQAKGEFLGATAKALVARLLDLSPAQALPLGEELLQLLQTRHIQMAFKDPRLVQSVHTRGWDGSIPPVEADSLLVVDTTVSYGDTYPFVTSQASLGVQLEQGSDGQLHELVLDYMNIYPRGLPPWMPSKMVGGEVFDQATGQLAQTSGFWGGWIRVYLPAKVEVTQVQGLTDLDPTRSEFGRTLVSGYLPLAPGQARKVTIRYFTHVGQEAGEDNYRIFLQKQAGLECRPTWVQAIWPGGKTASFEGCPGGDQWVELRAAD